MEAQTILNDTQLLPWPRLVHYAIMWWSRPLQLMGHNTLVSALVREIIFPFQPLLVCLSCAGLVASIHLVIICWGTIHCPSIRHGPLVAGLKSNRICYEAFQVLKSCTCLWIPGTLFSYLFFKLVWLVTLRENLQPDLLVPCAGLSTAKP